MVALAKADPGEQALHEPRPFRQELERLDDPPVEQPEIARMGRDGHIGQTTHRTIEQVRRAALRQGVAAPVVSYRDDVIVPFPPLRDEFVESDSGGSCRSASRGSPHRRLRVRARGERGFLTKLRLKSTTLMRGSARCASLQLGQRLVVAAVVDADDLVIGGGPLDDRQDALKEASSAASSFNTGTIRLSENDPPLGSSPHGQRLPHFAPSQRSSQAHFR